MNTNSATKTWLAGLPLLFGCFLARAADPLEPWSARYVAAWTVSDVAYGADLFVVAADVIYTSPDSVCWTRRPLDPAPINGLSGVAYGNGRFVAVEPAPWHRPGSAYTSTDGVSWQRSADLPGNSIPVIQRIDFGGGTFLAVGQEPNPAPASGNHWLVMTSPDGVTWNRHSGPTNDGGSYYLSGAAYGNGVYLVGGSSGNPSLQSLVLISTNLTNWVPATGFPPSTSVEGITYGKGIFVAAGLRDLGGEFEPAIATSSDGVRWTNQLQGFQGRLSAVAFGGDTFVAAGEPRLLLSSTDALNWRQHTTSVEALLGVTFGNGSFVAVGGFYTDIPRGVAVQSGGRPQVCLQPLGFGPSWGPGFRLLMTAESGRSYRLQSSSRLPADSWTDVDSATLPEGPWPLTVQFADSTASDVSQRFYRVVSP